MGDVRGLVVLVLGVIAGDELAADLLGPQVLGATRRVVEDDGVGGVEDPLRRPVVLLEDDDRGVGEGLLEPHEIAEVGPPELVDGLVVVADDHHTAVLLGEQPHELPLRGVRVLELVDEDVSEALPPLLEHVGMLPEQAHRQQQQVVEVGGRPFEQPPLVLAVDLGDTPVGGTGGPVESLLGGHELVLERRDLRRQPAGGEPLRVEVQVPAHVVDEPDRIGLVVDRERRADPELCGLAPQDARAGGMERRHPHAVGDGTDQLADPLFHLTGGLVGERDRQQRERRSAVVADQPRDTIGEHSRLAGSGPRDHEQRHLGWGGHRLPLHRVEPREQVSGLFGGAHDASQRIGAGSDVGAGFEAQLARHAVLRGHVVPPRARSSRVRSSFSATVNAPVSLSTSSAK